ncbi:MAG: hypothetical protein EXR00_03165 [Alphaproteobacteria bacterium]|nr:hypothetical protein [Alphaproteobacteria bacterium]
MAVACRHGRQHRSESRARLAPGRVSVLRGDRGFEMGQCGGLRGKRRCRSSARADDRRRPGRTAELDCVAGWLQRAAELGRKQAQAELSALAGQWELAHAFRENRDAHEDFARLRQSIDLSSWLSVPQARLVSESPRIGMVENFLRRDACDWLIARNRPHLARAQIYDTETGSLTDQGERTNTAAGLDFSRAGIVLIIARARMAAIAGLSVEGFEDSVLLHYDVGEEFSPHYDFFDPSVAGHAPELQAGQRVLTFLTYLNEGFEGGETGFPEIDRRYKGAKGEGLFFWNAALDGTPDPRTLHAGLPVATGEKWLLSQWIRHRTGL